MVTAQGEAGTGPGVGAFDTVGVQGVEAVVDADLDAANPLNPYSGRTPRLSSRDPRRWPSEVGVAHRDRGLRGRVRA